MHDDSPAHSWFGPTAVDTTPVAVESADEFIRLWQTLMSARLALGLVLVVLQTALYASGTSHSRVLVAVSAAYFLAALTNRLRTRPRPLGKAFTPAWLALVGLDVLAFSAMQMLQGSSINYTPLFALPILLASVLGSLRLALGTAAGITMLLLGMTFWTYLDGSADYAAYFVQPALSGVGYFAIALLANQLASRLASEGQRARMNQLAARIQRQVNELVIESLPDGVLIVDDHGGVRAANPAARQLLGSPRALHAPGFNLRDEAGWRPLADITRISLGTGNGQEGDVTIRHEGRGPSRVRARTRLTPRQDAGGESLCVLFLQDQREIEARMRTEKLASMGRMSAAVAHEIRNPLAAISQANALLDEDLQDPRLKQLTNMVSQNVKRLDKIVADVLNVSHVQTLNTEQSNVLMPLHVSALRISQDWGLQNHCSQRLAITLPPPGPPVFFDLEHLRRVLVNLLDNARRYASESAHAIQVFSSKTSQGLISLSVWSDGARMDQSVERHLFEPFFSSESRSSGLGLYICRELCEGYKATIVYQRSMRPVRDRQLEGNEFVITFAETGLAAPVQPPQ